MHKLKLSFVERAMWETLQKAPQNEVIIEKNWVQVTTSCAPVSYLNGVLKCSLPDSEVNERIKNVIAHYETLNLPFRFKISPSSTPSTIESILTENGLEKKETLYGLYIDPKESQIKSNPEVKIEQLTLSNLEDWLLVQASAWNVPPPGIEFIRTHNMALLERNLKKDIDFIAYYADKPVASAAIRLFQDYAYLMGAAVNPEMRKQGIYRTLLSHRLELLKEKNLPAVIHCLEKTSAPICLKLGFEKICEIYSYEPRRKAE